jgi:formylglycine-generating enzyme required for sulfatase activity
MSILHASFTDDTKATCRRSTIRHQLSRALLMVAGLSGVGVIAQEADELVTTGSVFEIGQDEVGDIGTFTAKPKVYGLYDHPVTEKVDMKAAAKFIAGLDTGIVQCEWTKRIPLYDKKLLSAANKVATFTAAWLVENLDQNQPLALDLHLGSKQVDPALPVRTVQLSPPLIDDVEMGAEFITITGRWFGTKKPKVWFEYLNANNRVKRLNCKVEKADGEDGRVNAKDKPVYMNPADGNSKVVVQQPRLPKGVVWDDLSHVVIDSGSGLAAETETYTVTYIAGLNGLVNGASQVTQVLAHDGSGPLVTAQPDASYHFVDWSDASTANPRQDLSVTGDITVTATFAINAISGTVSGDIAQGVTITLSGDAAATTTTDIDGKYSFEVPDGSYTVTPSMAGYVFNPFSKDVTISGGAPSLGNDFLSLGGGDGTYLVVDLATGATANLTLPPPDMPTSVEYKTTKMVFRRIPAGTFTMGSPGGELGKDTNETQHSAQLTQDYYLGVFAVTQAQYYAVMGTWPSYFNNPSYRDTRPVEQVAWDTIRGGTWPSGNPAVDSFMDKLRTLVGAGYPFDLPTDAQWEYACRAGTTTALNSGKNLTDATVCPNVAEVARYWSNGGSGYTPDGDLSVGTAEVGSYLPNNWGLWDMHGNTWEWCLDWYVADLGTDAVVDPVGAGTGTTRVTRSGAWAIIAAGCRSAYRASSMPSIASNYFGFRVALTPQD